MSIEIKKDNHYAGFWRATIPNGDFLAMLWKEVDDGLWHLTYRFRYYKDDKAFNSADEKSWHGVKSTSGDDSEKESMRKIMHMILRAGGEQFMARDISFLPCDCDGDGMTAILSDPERPCLHRAKLDKEQAEAFDKSGTLPEGVQVW